MPARFKKVVGGLRIASPSEDHCFVCFAVKFGEVHLRATRFRKNAHNFTGSVDWILGSFTVNSMIVCATP